MCIPISIYAYKNTWKMVLIEILKFQKHYKVLFAIIFNNLNNLNYINRKM